MLMTPMTPNVMASPMAISTSTEPEAEPEEKRFDRGIDDALDVDVLERLGRGGSDGCIGFDERAIRRFLDQARRACCEHRS